jgi:hypothetical protein
MQPEDVVAASMADLERGVVISIPGLDDQTVLDHTLAAQAELAPATSATSLPSRYRNPPPG